ncbi:MAG: CBS domain-containing protein [Candidatus Aenigmarchaeota archaeon]|nr:CBS domain-containing protein [Candidatus Aenigmarchaeota archaeon]
MIVMKVSDLMATKVISCSGDTPLSQVMGKMKQNGIHQMPVIDNGMLAGMVELRTIITRELDPVSAKARTVMTSTATISPDADAEDAVSLLIKSGSRALPVVNDNAVIGIISETDLLKVELKDGPVESLLSRCDYVEPSDDLGKAEHIMRYNNVSRVPVVDKGKVVGMVDTMDLISVYLKGKQKFTPRGRESGEKDKVPMYSISAGTVMKPPVIIGKREKISKVAALLQKNEHIAAYETGTVYTVTPKDILETLFTPEGGVPVQVTHLREDPITEAKINKILLKSSATIMKIEPAAGTMNIYVETHHDEGKKKYSMRARLPTPKGLFVAHEWGWNITDVAQNLAGTLEKEILRKYGRDRTMGKRAGESRKQA